MEGDDMNRTDRIAGEIQKEIADILRTDIKDPRLPDMVSVTAVRVTRDLRYAKVYISVLGSEEDKKNAMIALKNAAGFIRREIGQRIQLRYTPEITFLHDISIVHVMHISNLINKTLYPDQNE